jgi:MFS transporter, SP family, general alpha glucoside:H+ symporter
VFGTTPVSLEANHLPFSPFAIQWAWPIPILIGTILAPESPWWLCRQERDADAKKALRKLTSQDCGVPFDVDAQVAMMKGKSLLLRPTSPNLIY